jgi:hypothetical protein
MEFPSNLMTSSDIDNLITDINDENTSITVESILDSKGVNQHLNDMVSNANSTSGFYFKHEAKNIAVDVKNSNGTTKTVSLQDVIDTLYKNNNSIFNDLVPTS